MTQTKKKVLSTAPDAGEVERAYQSAHETITSKLGIPVFRLPAKYLAEIVEWVTQTKKNADFVGEFDGQWFTFVAVVGAKKSVISEVDVTALGDTAKVYQVKKKLADMGLAATPVDPAEIERMQKSIDDLGRSLETSKGVQQSYQTFTWDTDSPSMHGALYEWASKKSQAHYLDFLGAIKAKEKPQTIFDTYVKKGAKFPVNLPGAIVAAIEKDLKAGKTPSFAAAEKDILNVVKQKIIPAFKKWGLEGSAQYQKQVREELGRLKKQLATAKAH